MGKKLLAQPRIQRIGRPLGVRCITREIRRQEKNSDFTGYTENFNFSDLQDFLQLVGGPQWELRAVPISWIKCWNASAPLREIYGSAESDQARVRLRKQAKQLADKIRQGRLLPGIFVVKSEESGNAHWLLDGHRRLLAHRVAKAAIILVYHPVGMFSDNT